jgi:hypothetical protein
MTGDAVDSGSLGGHVFISYVREDSLHVDRLQRTLETAGVPVWRDTANLLPGEDWRLNIRRAITGSALVFIACFSNRSAARKVTFQNEELYIAIEQHRLRRPQDTWLIPVRFDDCDIPDFWIGGNRTLLSLQSVDLFGDHYDQAAEQLITAILRRLGPRVAEIAADPAASREGSHLAPSPASPVSSAAGQYYGNRASRAASDSAPGPGKPGRMRTAVVAVVAAAIVVAATLISIVATLGSTPHARVATAPTPSADAPLVYSAASYGFDGPDAIAVDGPYLWVANGGGSVTELNADNGSLVRVLSARSYGFNYPDAIAVDGTHVWVANYNDNSVTELNTVDGSLVQVLSSASYDLVNPDVIAIYGTHLWVAYHYGDSVVELNAADGSLVRTMSATSYGFDGPDAFAIVGNHLWVANEGGNSVTELSTG